MWPLIINYFMAVFQLQISFCSPRYQDRAGGNLPPPSSCFSSIDIPHSCTGNLALLSITSRTVLAITLFSKSSHPINWEKELGKYQQTHKRKAEEKMNMEEIVCHLVIDSDQSGFESCL